MSLELFSKLKEYDSLSKMRQAHEKNIKDQEERLTKLTTRLEENDLQTAKLRQSLLDERQKMHEIEKKLKSFQEQKQRLIDIGQSQKADTYSAQIDEAEEQGLSLLESLESIEQDLKDKKEFNDGIQKTIEEIRSEVSETCSQEKTSIKNLDLRLELILEELPKNFKETLQKVLSKKLAQGAFTKIEAGSCYFCRYKISRIDESEIDTQYLLKQCPQCGRIFLPYGA